MDQDETAEIAQLHQAIEKLRHDFYGLNSIPLYRASELNALADDFGLKYFHGTIHDQFRSLRQLEKSLARISRAIHLQYESFDTRFDVCPDYGAGWYEGHRSMIAGLLEEADSLVIRYDNDLARVRSAYCRARAEKGKGLWVPDLSAIVEHS